MIHKKKCPISVDGWMEFISSEIYIAFQHVFTSWLVILTAFMIIYYVLLSEIGCFLFYCLFYCVLFCNLNEFKKISGLKTIRTKIINGLRNTNEIRKEWKRNLDITPISFLKEKIRK
jgi:hypothetical protein